MRILLVDDHSLIRTGIRDSLTKKFKDIAILEADSSHSALALMQKQKFDLALVDLFIPGEKLFKLIRECCARDPELPVIVLSSSNHAGHIRQCIDLGVVGFVSKSSPLSVLFEAMDIALAGGTFYPPPLPAGQGAEPVESGTPDSLSLDYSAVSSILTRRQMDILTLMAQGKTNKEIARNLGLSAETVKVHVSAIFKNLGFHNRSQAAILGEKLGLTIQASES